MWKTYGSWAVCGGNCDPVGESCSKLRKAVVVVGGDILTCKIIKKEMSFSVTQGEGIILLVELNRWFFQNFIIICEVEVKTFWIIKTYEEVLPQWWNKNM